MLKIGCSTRMFILQGPEDDEEPESDLSVTEIKQQRLERLAAAEAERARAEVEEEERLKREAERGIDWGMGEYNCRHNYLNNTWYKCLLFVIL